MTANLRDMDRYQCKRLAPSLCRLLEACIEIKTTNTKTLAEHLCRSPATIRTQFQRILFLMEVHCRYEALLKAEEKGLIRSRSWSRRSAWIHSNQVDQRSQTR